MRTILVLFALLAITGHSVGRRRDLDIDREIAQFTRLVQLNLFKTNDFQSRVIRFDDDSLNDTATESVTGSENVSTTEEVSTTLTIATNDDDSTTEVVSTSDGTSTNEPTTESVTTTDELPTSTSADYLLNNHETTPNLDEATVESVVSEESPPSTTETASPHEPSPTASPTAGPPQLTTVERLNQTFHQAFYHQRNREFNEGLKNETRLFALEHFRSLNFEVFTQEFIIK